MGQKAFEPYVYKYGIQDDLSGTNFEKSESQNVIGNVGGSFSVVLPDGRIQTVTYTADHDNGFVADVTYSGEAVFPDVDPTLVTLVTNK